MAKKKIDYYVFEPGISKDVNLLPNAVALLLANKAFLQQEVVRFINYNITNDIGPYVGYTYASAKCTRDVGFFIDAIAHDLRYGGNVKTRLTSDYFWINGEPQIRGDVSPEITGQRYLRDIINEYIFTNTTVPPVYGTPISPQIKITGSPAEVGADSRNTELWDIFGNVIQTGTSAIPFKSPGATSIRLLGKYSHSDFLLITDTTSGEILYNFSDPATSITLEYKSAKSSGDGEPVSDIDFPTWWQTADYITTVYLSKDTSNLSENSDLQIFVEEPYQTIRPWEFGTDAIERMRVAAPQAMLDADFEYGLQPTKWQAIGLMRNYPSLYEISGTDLSVAAVTTDASVNSGNFGSSLITVTTNGSHGFTAGTPITVKGLNGAVPGFSRAEGSFLVYSVPSSLQFTFYASAKVGTTPGDSLYTSFVQIRQAGFYTGASIGSATYSLFSNGSSASVATKFDTPIGSYQIAFDGTSPTPGSPISGSPYIPAGSSVSGVIGSSTVISNLKTSTQPTDTTIFVVDATGIQEGMAIDDGAGNSIFVNSVTAGNALNLSAPFNQTKIGANNSVSSISGTNIPALGTAAAFNVSRSASVYTVLGVEDSSSNGQNYSVGDKILLEGASLGGVSPENDIYVNIESVDSAGTILSFTYQGTAISGGGTYNGILADQTLSVGGGGALLDVQREGGTGTYTVSFSSGGAGYQPNDELTWYGANFGGITGVNDIVIRVDGVAFGTNAIVDYTILSGVGDTGDASYTAVPGINVPNSGSSAIFSIEAVDGIYIAQPLGISTGVNYNIGNRITIDGSQLFGISPLNDCILTVENVGPAGEILAVSAYGTPHAGDIISVYPAMTISEAITGEIPSNTTLNVGAIATIQVDFASNHGLLPGSTILSNVTSQPAPAFNSTVKLLPASLNWVSTAFINGTFVAIANNSATTGRSIDGESWTAGGSLPAASGWVSVAAGLIGVTPYFVAIASGGTVAAYSTDGGLTWASSTLPSSGTWSSVTYYNGYFIAVRSGSNAGAYSTDGINWVASTLPATATWTDVVGGVIGTSNYIVAIASGGTAAAYSVDNGVNWTTSTLPATATWSSIAFGNSRFVAIASGGTSAAVSTTGTTWTAATLPSTANWNNITFGDDVFVVVADSGTSALTSFNGTTGSYTPATLAASGTWEETAYGNYSGLGKFVTVGSGSASVLAISLTSANHNLASGPFVITRVPSPTSIRFPARTTGNIDTTVSALTGVLYARPDAFFTHRPFDGGVMLGTGGPQHGAQAIRQSKKYIRYQSGKGIMYTTGALFAPNYNLASAVAVDYPAGSYITMTTDDTDHGLQPGGTIEVSGFTSFEYNGVYTVESIISARSFRVRALVPLSTLNAELGANAKLAVKGWHGSTVRVGAFDDQNGIFYQYDGQQLALVRRSATFQLSGQISIATESNQVFGTGTRFTQQLKVHDKIVIRGMTHTVTSIPNDTTMTVTPDWRGVNSIVGAKACKIQDLIIPQSEWNMDKGDGTGPSGYNIIPQRMQMIGIQYSWYAAGFIEFMVRGSDGKFVFLHRMRNSNINFEAYMRTANLPVRYEVENRSALDKLSAEITSTSTSLTLYDASMFPQSGTLYIDNELIHYSSKSGNRLSGLSRSANLSNFSAGQNRTYTAGPAAAHGKNAGVALVSCTITPTINHWGSAILTDGLFDNDRGYIFNYAATGLSATVDKQTAFMIRLAPSVSNALVGDLGERDLLNRAQLLLNEVAVTADSGSGALVIEGILNPRNYPSDPTKITWNGLSTPAAGGQPSFAQIALGGSINWGGTPLTTSTAAVQGALSTTISARGFSAVTNIITAVANGPIAGYSRAIDTNRTDFLIADTQYDSLTTTTPLRVGDTLSVGSYINRGQTISSVTRSYQGTSYTRIVMNTFPNATSPNNSDINVTVTNSISSQYASAYSTSRQDFLVTNANYTSSGLAAGDSLSVATYLTGNQTVTTITPSYALVNGVQYTRIVMNNSANSISPAGSNITTTITAAGTAASYANTNYLYFTNASWNASGASVGTRVSSLFTQFPAGTSVASVTSRTLGTTTIRRVTFTQTSNASIAAGGTVTFQFGDVQYALPGEQVFSFISQPGSSNSLDLTQLKELTTTAIGGRGAFPNGPDVLAINIYKVSGTAVPAGIILRWGEAQA